MKLSKSLMVANEPPISGLINPTRIIDLGSDGGANTIFLSPLNNARADELPRFARDAE